MNFHANAMNLKNLTQCPPPAVIARLVPTAGAGRPGERDTLLAILATRIPLAMVLMDGNAGVQLVTQAARELLGITDEQRAASDLCDRVDPTLAANVRQVLTSGEPLVELLTLGTPARRVERRIEPCRSAQNVVVGACVTYHPDDRAQLAHDLRSPLTAISMWAKFLRSRPLGEAERAQGLDTIIRSVETQQAVIDRFAKG